MALIENILNVFINSRERDIRLDVIELQLKILTIPTDIKQLNMIFRCLTPLFKFINKPVDLGVSVEILV